MPSIMNIPVEVFLDNIFPTIPVPDLLHLACTCRFFATLIGDENLWKYKLQADFNFSPTATARSGGWKLIYKGLDKPKVFVWGANTDGRLGLTEVPTNNRRILPFPVELRIPKARIVSLMAGGWSFHALDSTGRSYVWGTLDGEAGALNNDSFAISGKLARTPHKLRLPMSMRTVSCGRAHTMTMDVDGGLWLFLSWGRPFRLVTPVLDCSSSFSTPLQAECGWAFSAVLTQVGDVFVFWPFGPEMMDLISAANRRMDEEKTQTYTSEGVIHCTPTDLAAFPVKLSELPLLPDLEETNEHDEPIRLISIAGLDNCLVGLTNEGHVLKFAGLENSTTASLGRWEYLPNFSEVERVRQHPTFTANAGYNPPKSPERMRIAHVTASFQHFFAYSTGMNSVVLMGNLSTSPESEPTINPVLQNKSVISVVVGDYHYGALTSTGKLLTWGECSLGALGLGDPTKIEVGKPGGFADEAYRQRAISQGWGVTPRVDVPTEVRFDHGLKKRRDRFCFAAAARGWHTGALVIDLDDSDESEEESAEQLDPEPAMSGAFPTSLPRPPFLHHGPGNLPTFPTGRGGGIFRIGFAGRGMSRGGFGS